ncbi:hypothetical protein QCB45_05025 [Thiomicrorhabdus sp. ZW0627]|uniref:hypothetical protein n=1 Tax=Thiomicrorhabdus sp. ZW0627 TaxID=3039774 RepID=UPI0024365A16|nr:hypothetical protein [Thiomicrorhabdus sp. ZW0627]MDG6773685.1 hypothetical protein [Thiomicrorhabdus sp. ZW0627]
MKKLLVAVLASSVMAGCSMNQEKPEAKEEVKKVEAKAAEQALNNDDLYIVYHEGRMNVFYDADLYKGFLAVGETPFRKTFIGAGPKGETVVHGLTKADKKKLSGIPSIEMLEGRMPPADPFYGEIVSEGRINVFDNWDLFKAFMAHGEVPFRLTVIGGGPKGETVVYALTKAEKKKRPEALISKFKAFHGM